MDVDRGMNVVLDQPLREHDGILEVVSVPRHEGNDHVRAERELAHFRGGAVGEHVANRNRLPLDRKSTRLNSSHVSISYAVFCLKKKIMIVPDTAEQHAT